MQDAPRPATSAKAAARRAQIAAAASRYIIEHGYDNLSVNDLASQIGISIGGMYRYISTKSDLLVMVCQDIYGDLRNELGRIAADSSPVHVKLASAIDYYLREVDTKRAQIAMMYREYRSLPADAQAEYKRSESAIADVFADLIRAGTKRRDFRPVNSRVMAMDIVFLGHMPAFKWWALREVVVTDELRLEQVELIMSRLTSPEEPDPHRESTHQLSEDLSEYVKMEGRDIT